MPSTNEELFINSNALAISELTINETLRVDKKYFTQQRIRLELEDLREGWNIVSLKYFTPYQKNRTGLH
jgi:hypothetical protein